MTETQMAALTRDDVREARERIGARVRRTPLLHAGEIATAGEPATLLLKCEYLQHTGSFKARGAFNRVLATLERGELPREVVIEEAIATQDFTAKLDDADLARIQELADILQELGSLKTRDGKPFDTSAILDLSWQDAREL